MDCNHERIKQGWVERDFLGARFRCKGIVCDDCGASLWNKEIQLKFRKWIDKLYKDSRSKFQVQFALSKNAETCLSKLAESYYAVDASTLMRALVMVYLKTVYANQKLSATVETVVNGDVFHSFYEGSAKRKKLQFKPNAMLEIVASAVLIDLTPDKLVIETLNRMLAIFVENDPKLKQFWEENIKTCLEMILQAA